MTATDEPRSARHARIIAEIECDLAEGGGAGPDAPDAATVLAECRRGDAPPRLSPQC
ncbi:hypothetical protein [Saccharomonospora piscinae]|uniref:hypothetical protein n=1 Tax=Saccharomonospora piscinae TaxID=687388 RepID=UPI00159320CD|nr:hypothetical protein [Saccharomonospora piscinae]